MEKTQRLVCKNCHSEFALEKPDFLCSKCRGLLSFPLIDYHPANNTTGIGIWRYSKSLPLSVGCTLGEGHSPLLPAISKEISPVPKQLYLKVETGNPTGSFKDRGSAVVISAAMAFGCTKVAIASTGNAGASISAYAARQALKLVVFVPNVVDTGKLWQLDNHGAEIRKIQGDFFKAEEEYKSIIKENCFPTGSDNPYRTEGTKTIAYEIFEQMASTGIDRVIVPVGTGNLIVSMFKGFSEIVKTGFLSSIPILDAVQLKTITPLSLQTEIPAPLTPPYSIATGINVPKALLAKEAMDAVTATGGLLHAVSDYEIIAARRDLAQFEGIGTEPTGAVCIAAYRNAIAQKLIDPGEKVVVLITGHILKQPMN